MKYGGKGTELKHFEATSNLSISIFLWQNCKFQLFTLLIIANSKIHKIAIFLSEKIIHILKKKLKITAIINF
jgi:hypothetical protein